MNRRLLRAVALTLALVPGVPATAEPAAHGADAPATAIDMPNARHPRPGVLTGGQPSVQQIELAKKAGYRTIINLRPVSEPGSFDEEPTVRKLGMRYVHIPVAGAPDLTPENADALMRVINDPATHPVLVHCSTGNRVGALFALDARFITGKVSKKRSPWAAQRG